MEKHPLFHIYSIKCQSQGGNPASAIFGILTLFGAALNLVCPSISLFLFFEEKNFKQQQQQQQQQTIHCACFCIWHGSCCEEEVTLRTSTCPFDQSNHPLISPMLHLYLHPVWPGVEVHHAGPLLVASGGAVLSGQRLE